MLVSQPIYAIRSSPSNHIYFGLRSLALNSEGTTGYSDLSYNYIYKAPSFVPTNEIDSFLGGNPSFNVFEIEVYSQSDRKLIYYLN
jgi:hypothetical protein